MGGKNKKVTVGYHYHVAYHHGLGATPFDAFLEFRAADKTAWSGELTASGTIHIDAPNLFGGEKDQGGIVGDVDIMFGEPTQQPNAYLAATFGDQQPGWLGVTTLVFRGGRFGANNPYPQKPAYKIRAIEKGWDGDVCWYPEKAPVDVISNAILPVDADGWEYQILADQADPGNTALVAPADGWAIGKGPFAGGTLVASGNTTWPIHTVLWARKTVVVPPGIRTVVLRVVAENGCVVFVNGEQVGAVNQANADIPNNQQNAFVFPFSAGATYDVVIKAFDETVSGGGTFLSAGTIDLQAMNPAHILYDALTSQDRGAEPIASINDASFRAAADWFYGQGFGLCTQFDPDAETVEQFIARIEKAAGCSVSRSPVNGEWYLDIANGVYTLADLPILTDDDILEFGESPSTLDDAVNSISVEYVDVEKKVTATTPPAQALALVAVNGVHHDVHQYHEVPTAGLAARIVQRDLQAAVTPNRAFDLTTTRKPFAWRVNTYFRLQCPKRGITDMVCLLAEKSSGTLKSGAMKLTVTENIYSVPPTSFVEVEPGVDTRPPQMPTAISVQRTMEAPYLEVVPALSRADLAALPSDVGYAIAMAADPAGNLGYTMMVSPDGVEYTEVADGAWCATATVNETATPADTAFTLANRARLDAVTVGMAALWDDEIVRVDEIDIVTGAISLGRGCADTSPAALHVAGSRIWFYQTAFAFDTTEYAAAETVDVKLLSYTGSQQSSLASAIALPLTFASRQARPYPPGNLTLQGKRYPEFIEGALVIGWSHRDRTSQADQVVDTLMTDMGPETGVTYQVDVYLNNALDSSATGISGTTYTPTVGASGSVRVEITAVRGALSSWMPLAATFEYTPAGEFRVTESGELRITDDGAARAVE